MEKITLGDENIESIGLVFEPDFFRINCYSDENGEHFAKSLRYKKSEQYDFVDLRSKNHLYSTSTLPSWTLIPSAIFREEDAAEYLKLNTEFSPGDEFSFRRLEGLEAVLIYRKDVEAEKLMERIQPAMEGGHVATPLLEHVRRKSGRNANNYMQVAILDGIAVIIIFKNGKLLLANSIEVDKSEDLLYYIFYSLKKLGVSTDIETDILGYGQYLTSVRKQALKFLKNLKNIEPDSGERRLAEIISQCA
jgi:hypothetical protein